MARQVNVCFRRSSTFTALQRRRCLAINKIAHRHPSYTFAQIHAEYNKLYSHIPKYGPMTLEGVRKKYYGIDYYQMYLGASVPLPEYWGRR